MKTLIIVDPQYDFMPGGALEVKNGDEIVPVINSISDKFGLVVATQDWHPSGHSSFASSHEGKKPFDKIEWRGMEQILWPDHCVQGSKGAAFHADLETNRVEAIFRKGMDPEIDSYSGFFDNGHEKSTGLSGYLKEKNVSELYFAGLAADICVYFTLKDALQEGFKVNLIEDAVRPLNADDFEGQKNELKTKGVQILSSKDL
ncbi:bifunctional pyrazinamidase/nicotinamidase [Marivirga tractuosa]|uniref:Nicotinamidase n=1 Tax=Marivirga tractuosa (strain ATCC 23168 / DSM 4126 / NBRC 15989 / NCIMB 1408 / VKM B-1430 / H-43) TaxID=643867 RepID=E4TUJ8_MARTH|nr:bifunctional nicotinamidase/pyrazinamidase [Marivirga tractuosa]ADR23091.1 Nicotinamidase [Marivirga tractuosa DSM 4126]BDD16235.1 bifunctional pyrazinamidase/nicotinamidase [Marivirga tractuosa]